MKDVLSLLASERLAVIGVPLAGGIVHCAVMHYSFDSERVEMIFSTDARSVKVRDLADGLGGVAVGWSEESWVTVQGHGGYRVMKDSTELRTAQERHYHRHPSSAAFRDDPYTRFMALRLEWLRYSDLGVQPEIVQEFSRGMNGWEDGVQRDL